MGLTGAMAGPEGSHEASGHRSVLFHTDGGWHRLGQALVFEISVLLVAQPLLLDSYSTWEFP